MKKINKTLLLLLFTTTLFSCLDEDPVTNNFTNCTDVTYYGLRTSEMSNPAGTVDVVKNSNSNITNTTFDSQLLFDYSYTVGNNSGTYNATTHTMVFLDEWNGNKLIVYNLTTNNHQIVALNSANVLSAPIFIGNRLYILEFENFPGTNVYLKEILNISLGTLSPILMTIPKSSFDSISDTMKNSAYSTTNGFDKIYFLGTSLLEIQIIPGYPHNFKALPSIEKYLDIVSIQTGELLTIKRNVSSMDLIKWNISGSAVTETIQKTNLDINPESVALVYKECGDRLHILTHKRFDESKIHEINILNNNMVTKDFPGFIFGIIHKNN